MKRTASTWAGTFPNTGSRVNTCSTSGRRAVAQPHHQKKSSEQGLEHRRILDAGLKLLSADDLKPSTTCPDSWTFALYVQGQLDEDARRSVNAHIAFCSECYREYLALAEPEDVMKEVDRELHSTTT